MSLTKSTTRRRLSLMAGSSFALAGLTAALSFGTAVLAPTAAHAENECAPVGATGPDPADNGAVADTYACTGASTYATTGITYESVGDLRVDSTGAMTVGPVGVNLSDGLIGNAAVGTDDLTFTATGTITGSGGAAIEALSEAGDITIQTVGITANTGTATHAIRAISNAGGAISVTHTTGTINANSNTVTTGEAAIEARSTGGAGAVSVTTGTSSVTGRLRGVYAQSSGTGALTVTTNATVGVNSAATAGGVGQIAAIDAISGTGLMTLNIGGSVNGSMGNAIRTQAGGGLIVNLGANAFLSAVARDEGATLGKAVMNLTAAGPTTITNDGSIRSTGSNEVAWADLAIDAAGSSLLLDNRNYIQGRVDFSGVTGGVTFNNSGAPASGRGWSTTGASVFSPGADVLSVATGYRITVSALATTGVNTPTSWDFGAGADTINLAAGAMLALAPVSANLLSQGELEITNLEAFNSAGTILLGSSPDGTNSAGSDGDGDDRLAMEGAAFTGSGASRITVDVDFQGMGQATCEAAVVADCVDLRDGSTAGSTVLFLYDASTRTSFAGYLGEGVVLIDVSGGTSAASHFTLDPTSSRYVATGPNAGLMEKGYFLFALVYDAENVQHKLISVPNSQLMSFTALPQAVQSVWHTSTGMAFGRQAQLRGAQDGGGVWLSAAGEESERDLNQAFSQLGVGVDYDTDYTQQTNSLTGGVDMAGEAWGGVYSVGAMIGYVRSELEFDDILTNATWEGATLGLYGGYGRGAFHLDAAVNGLAMAADLEDPAVDLPTGLINREVVRAVGARAEAGYRLDLGGVFIEPLVAASYMRARFDQLVLEQAKLDYDDPTSARLGAGLRVGADIELATLTVRFDLTGRLWNEFDGENGMVVDNDGVDLALFDDFSGTFSEVSAGASLVSQGGLGLFANVGGKANDGYQAVTGALGLTYRW